MSRLESIDQKGLSELYDAATDEVAWGRFCDTLARHLGVNTTGLWIIEDGTIREMVSSAGHAESIGRYAEYYAKLDVWSARLIRTRDQVTLTNEIFDEDALIDTEFYNDFGRQFGHFRPMGVHLSIEPGVTAIIAIENRFTDNLFEAADKAIFRPIIPHLRRIIQLRRLWTKQQNQNGLLRTTLDAIGFGIVVCHGDGRVAVMNDAAEQLVKRLGNIRFSGMAPLNGSRNREETRRLAQLVHDAANGGPGGVMPLAGPEGLPVVTALISPLGRTLAEINGTRYAAVALQPVTGATFLTEDAIANSFGLTKAQASVAHALLNGSNVDDIVAQRGVKMSTVRSQLAAIFARTGTTSQRELVRMLSMLPAIRF